MAAIPPILTAFLDFCISHIHAEGSTVGMKAKAAKHFGVNRCTISRWIADLRSSKAVGRDVFRAWLNSRD